MLIGKSAIAQEKLTQFFPAAASGTAGQANLRLLLDGYITPLAEDFGSMINNGWYNTAATHKRFGFDISVTVNTVFAKGSEDYFSVPNLNGLTGSTGGRDRIPTVYGPDTPAPQFGITSGANSGATFAGPGGATFADDIPVGSAAIPTLQLGLGLFANTDIRVRYTPTVEIEGTELSNWGVGIHHDIKQHIPGLKALPFSLSALVAYSKFTATTDLSGVYNGSNTQEGVAETTAYTIQILVSKKLAFLTVYGGLGFNQGNTEYRIDGTYVVDKTAAGVALSQPVTLVNPYNREVSASGVRATGGLRLNLGPIIFNGDYTLAGGNGLLTVGAGLSVR